MRINFKKTVGTRKIDGVGILVGEHLVVSLALHNKDRYQIYRLHDGKLFLSTQFNDLDNTVELATWLDTTYNDYFCIWTSYPDADVISLSKWSVKNGIRIFELIQEIQNKSVDKSIIQLAWLKSKQKINYWVRGIRHECIG